MRDAGRDTAGTVQGAAGGAVDTVRASWRRCERYGVSPEDVEPVFTGDLDTGSLFYTCGEEVLRSLGGTLAGEPVSLMITDSSGLVLLRLHDEDGMRRDLDAVHLAPGFSYAEEHAGTTGLGLALADRRPALVRGEEHWCAALQRWTCAAAPVLDPCTGDVVGSVNLTTWSGAASGLLLALAQAAAGSTSALMLARSAGAGASAPGAPGGSRGRVFHVEAEQPAPAADVCVSAAWRAAVDAATAVAAAGRVLAVTGEPGAGRGALAARAARTGAAGRRVLRAVVPAPAETAGWLAAWTPELRAGARVVLRGAERLPAWAADEVAAAVAASLATPAAGPRPGGPPLVLVAGEVDELPAPLLALVGGVVTAPPLRERPEDVLPLAERFASRGGRRAVRFTPAAARALGAHPWPGGVGALEEAVRRASARTDLVDLQHLPPDVLTTGGRVLTRLERLERDEIVRALTAPGTSVAAAAASLGLSRATVYRKLAQYGVVLPR
ncbi:helix-turn-helix domain-containing protein [Kineococcus terrestris]|uniref:helix-turn-helix domain-containing protein n=1 Tax=Kineococcus terrestris TaxID=2044856 RepID=UPI0034DACD33